MVVTINFLMSTKNCYHLSVPAVGDFMTRVNDTAWVDGKFVATEEVLESLQNQAEAWLKPLNKNNEYPRFLASGIFISNTKKTPLRCPRMKAVDGFEPTIKLLQSRALPLGYTAITDTILSKNKDSVKSLSSN